MLIHEATFDVNIHHFTTNNVTMFHWKQFNTYYFLFIISTFCKVKIHPVITFLCNFVTPCYNSTSELDNWQDRAGVGTSVENTGFLLISFSSRKRQNEHTFELCYAATGTTYLTKKLRSGLLVSAMCWDHSRIMLNNPRVSRIRKIQWQMSLCQWSIPEG